MNNDEWTATWKLTVLWDHNDTDITQDLFGQPQKKPFALISYDHVMFIFKVTTYTCSVTFKIVMLNKSDPNITLYSLVLTNYRKEY